MYTSYSWLQRYSTHLYAMINFSQHWNQEHKFDIFHVQFLRIRVQTRTWRILSVLLTKLQLEELFLLWEGLALGLTIIWLSISGIPEPWQTSFCLWGLRPWFLTSICQYRQEFANWLVNRAQVYITLIVWQIRVFFAVLKFILRVLNFANLLNVNH